MKKIVVLILLILTIANLNAQKRDIVEYKQNWDEQTVFWGYFLGINQKDYKITYQYDGAFIMLHHQWVLK